MDETVQPPGVGREAETSVPAHYAALTNRILKYSGDLLVCHYGLWGPDTTSHREALLRSNDALVQGCDLIPGRRVLDAGCGLGGMAIWLAETYGVHVTGLTNCEPHIAVAKEHAERRGLGHLVEIRHGDFMELPFSDASFDAVLNHESFCYATDKLAYLRGVYRVLKPGGRWQALEGLLSGEPISEAQEATHASVQWGFRMPPLEPLREVLESLEEAGFDEIREQNLSAEVAPATDRIRQWWLLASLLMPPPSEPDRGYHEYMRASLDFDRGLREGVFTFRFVSGSRPA